MKRAKKVMHVIGENNFGEKAEACTGDARPFGEKAEACTGSSRDLSEKYKVCTGNSVKIEKKTQDMRTYLAIFAER